MYPLQSGNRSNRPSRRKNSLRVSGCRLRPTVTVPFAGGPHSGTDGSQTPRWREMDSNFRFRVRCKRGLGRKSPASAACRRRSSAAAVGGHQRRRKAKSRYRTLIALRTGSSNPSPSSGESEIPSAGITEFLSGVFEPRSAGPCRRLGFGPTIMGNPARNHLISSRV